MSVMVELPVSVLFEKEGSDGGNSTGADVTVPTHNSLTLALGNIMGASDIQNMEQVGGATNPDLRTNSPIRSRTDVGAFEN